MMILSDNETKIDMLNNKAIAVTIIDLINESKDEPISLGIHGDWGAGKSSVLEMVEHELESNKEVECIRFNGWKHQGFENAKIALMSNIVSELIEKRKLSEKCKSTIGKIWKNINWLSVAKGVGGVALTATTGIPPVTMLTSVFDDFKSSITNKEKVASGIEKVGGFLQDSKVFSDTSLIREFTEFQNSFEELIKESKIEKLVVLIDDLDRCLPEFTIETLEAIKLLMFAKSTAFVIAADETMIEYAVNKHFPDIIDSSYKNLGREFSAKYLEKLVQVPFRIPTLGEVESRMYITLLLIGSKLKADDKKYADLLDTSIKKMKKPWQNNGLPISQISEVLGEKYSVVIEEVSIASQISAILATNADGNPRKIKRFINMLLLRHKIATARGFGEDIKLPILAKMMLAEYFLNDFYVEIAAMLDENGKCSLITELENMSIETHGSNEENVDTESENTEEEFEIITKADSTLERWKSDAKICEWIYCNPKIGQSDLRPYYFACKEKQDYFSSGIKSEKLREIIDGLMSTAMNIARYSGELKNLTTDDAKYIFDILSNKILGQGDLQNKPKGLDGIIELVSNHQELQKNLLNLIETFDVAKVGIWACSGWNKCIRSTNEVKRLEEFYHNLSENGNEMVKKIASKFKGGH